MLLAIEGGGFFTYSASGYSKGLTLLLLGQKTENRSMRVSPWNQYQLVDFEFVPHFQLASTKKIISRGCTSFICFCRAHTGAECPSPSSKNGPVHQSHSLQRPTDTEVKDDTGENMVSLKSNLKKPFNNSVRIHEEANPLEEAYTEKRRVQWTDACGGDLVEIREFDVSSLSTSEETLEDADGQNCWCVIQ